MISASTIMQYVNAEQTNHIFNAAIKELEDTHSVVINKANIAFDSYPQHNADGSITYSVIVIYDHNRYCVEVYADKGIYTADCWAKDGTLIGNLALCKEEC